MDHEDVSFSIVLTLHAHVDEGKGGSGRGTVYAPLNHDKSQDSRNAPGLETHRTEQLPQCMLLYNFKVQNVIV
jgi:hypothetical protein